MGGKIEQWKRKRKEKKQKEAEKWKKPTLEERIHELELKHGELEKKEFIDGKLHYFFIDGAIIFFESGFGGIKAVYKNKGYIYYV